jgi:hypothetical protein
MEAIPALLNKMLVNLVDPGAITLELDQIIANQTKRSNATEQIQDRTWRKLTDAERAAAESQLLPFAGQKASIQVGNLTADRVALGKQLAQILMEAKWEFRGITTPTAFFDSEGTEFPRGIVLRVGGVTPAVEALGRVLVGIFGRPNVGVWDSIDARNSFSDETSATNHVKSLPNDEIEIQIWRPKAP